LDIQRGAFAILNPEGRPMRVAEREFVQIQREMLFAAMLIDGRASRA
jgi:hypothetical protein